MCNKGSNILFSSLVSNKGPKNDSMDWYFYAMVCLIYLMRCDILKVMDIKLGRKMTIAMDNISKLLTNILGRYFPATLYVWGIGLLSPEYRCQYFSERLYVCGNQLLYIGSRVIMIDIFH